MPKPRCKQIALSQTPRAKCGQPLFSLPKCGQCLNADSHYLIPMCDYPCVDSHFSNLTLTFLQPQLKLMENLSG